MSASNIRAGRAYVELAIKDKLDQGLRRAQGKLSAFGAGLRTVSAAFSGLAAGGPIGLVVAGLTAGVAAAITATKTFANTGSALHDMSQRTGLATDNLSELKFAAEQSGASLEDVERAIKNMQRQGIAAKDFNEIAHAVANIADETERAQVALKLWGRSGTAILPMLKELPGMRREARMLGVSVSPARASAADDLGDSFGRLKAAVHGLMLSVGSTAALFTPLINVLAYTIGALNRLGTMFANLARVGASAAITALLDSIKKMTGVDLKGILTKVWAALAKALGMPPGGGGKRPSFFDFGLDDLVGSKVGGSSRGQFGGVRGVGALGIGSNASMLNELKGLKEWLKRIHEGVKETTEAVEGIDGPAFT